MNSTITARSHACPINPIVSASTAALPPDAPELRETSIAPSVRETTQGRHLMLSLYKHAIDVIQECREQTLTAWDPFIEQIDYSNLFAEAGEETRIDVPSWKLGEPSEADKRDGVIEQYDEAIDWLESMSPDASKLARAALELAVILEDEAGMVIRARRALASIPGGH